MLGFALPLGWRFVIIASIPSFKLFHHSRNSNTQLSKENHTYVRASEHSCYTADVGTIFKAPLNLKQQSRDGGKLVRIWWICPRNGTAVLKGVGQKKTCLTSKPSLHTALAWHPYPTQTWSCHDLRPRNWTWTRRCTQPAGNKSVGILCVLSLRETPLPAYSVVGSSLNPEPVQIPYLCRE